jgi:hypothetical protein
MATSFATTDTHSTHTIITPLHHRTTSLLIKRSELWNLKVLLEDGARCYPFSRDDPPNDDASASQWNVQVVGIPGEKRRI